jgi:hypothetical protein
MRPTIHGTWKDTTKRSEGKTFICGYCGAKVSSDIGFFAMFYPPGALHQSVACSLLICPGCDAPTLVDARQRTFPPPIVGREIVGVPENIERLYDEARACQTASSPTGCASVCRILLMHVAHDVMKKKNEREKPQTPHREKPHNFKEAIQWLVDEGEITKKQAAWVDHVREGGNDANHELDEVEPKDATRVLMLIETLLATMYEAPSRIAGG